MTIRFPLAASALAPLIVLAACGSSEQPAPVETDPMAGLAAPEPAADSARPTDAQGFVDLTAASNLYEIEAGKLAQQSSANQAIKDFGKMMEADHTKATADLTAAAGTVEGVTVTPQLSAEQESDLAALKRAGDTFDSVYKTQQLAAHRQTLALLQNYAANGDQAPLKDFAGTAAPLVEGHLEKAQTLP